MNHVLKYLLLSLAYLLALFFIIFIAAWMWILFDSQPLHNPLARAFPWPVACSSRGCVTSQTWAQKFDLAGQFATQVHITPPTPASALTTVIRQHLARHAFLRSPVSVSDAKRYREDILNLKDAEQLQGVLHLSVDDYDRLIVLPFLQQEALRAQYKIESTDQLYAALARERAIILLPWHFTWDKSKGIVIEK